MITFPILGSIIAVLGVNRRILAAGLLLAIAVAAEDAGCQGFTSDRPAKDWEEGLLTGNGVIGAIVPGVVASESIPISHAGLYLPMPDASGAMRMAPLLPRMRQLCRDGKYQEAFALGEEGRDRGYRGPRDPFIGGLLLDLRQPEMPVEDYRRSVDFSTAEATVTFRDGAGTHRRRVFASRADDVLVVVLDGGTLPATTCGFAPIPARTKQELALVREGIKSSTADVADGRLRLRTRFARTNTFNPNAGAVALGRLVATGGTSTVGPGGVTVTGASRILLLVKLRPVAKGRTADEVEAELARELDQLPADDGVLRERHVAIHRDLMERVAFSLAAPEEDRRRSTEALLAAPRPVPLAQVERAFAAGRYNIICATGHHPPNLQGLWSGTWSAPWSGSFTTNGNLSTAVSFLLMGGTPELMAPFFRFFDARWDGFRRNARDFFGARGFHIPAQMTMSPLETEYMARFPHHFSQASAPWMLGFYHDYWLYTGDRRFLEDRCYPLMREHCGFYEDFLTERGADGRVLFAPSYSPENFPGGPGKCPVTINATIDVAAARRHLASTIAEAEALGRDADRVQVWKGLLAALPAYGVAPDGSFREWLWPGLDENNAHRHASHLFPLFDDMPEDILGDPALVAAVRTTIAKRLQFREENGVMAFGLVHLGLASAHIRDAASTAAAIDRLAAEYWTTGMASLHNPRALFNMDISGGYPALCASALIYGEPGVVRVFPARPAAWRQGRLAGIRLRGGLRVTELAWSAAGTVLRLVADRDQTVEVGFTGGAPTRFALVAGREARIPGPPP